MCAALVRAVAGAVLVVAPGLAVSPSGAVAQGQAVKTAAQAAANKASARVDSQTRAADAKTAQTKADTKGAQAKTDTKAAQTKAAPPAAQTKGATPPAGAQSKGAAPPAPAADTNTVVIMREVFSYPGAGRRDPFLSLLVTDDLRPALSDLQLVTIIYSPQGGSVANLKDLFNKKPVMARVGTELGRMRVVGITRRAVVFSIDDFGISRLDSLVRADTVRKSP